MTLRLAMMTTFLGSAVLAGPPEKIILRPNGAPTTAPASVAPVVPSPERPGMIVIRPQAPGTRVLETPTAAPVAPSPKPGMPLPDPKPIDNPQPATPQAPKTPTTQKPEEKDDPAKGKLLHESFDVAFVKGMKVGYFHVVVREYIRDGKTYIYGVKRQQITIGRFGQKIMTVAEDSNLEDTQGNVLTVRMTQEVSSGQKLQITGRVKGQLLEVKAEGIASGVDTVPWPEGVLGISKELSLYKDKKPKPGDTFEYNVFEGRASRAVKITVTCKSQETVQLDANLPAKPYLKMEAQMEPIGKFRIPPATVWVDAATFETVRTDQDLPSLGGRLTLMRSTKEVAERPVGDVPDLFDVQSIRLDKELPGVHDKNAVTYKIDLSIDFEPYSCFPKDDRQTPTLTGPERKHVDLKVLNSKLVAAPATPQPEPKDEIYLSQSFFIDWDNEETKKQAAAIAATLPMNATAADKARAIEAWVKKNMKAVEYSQAMAPTSEVSKTLKGDCTEFSMLAVGLARAMGLKSQTTLGLVYGHNKDNKPILGYHMWFEVWHDGRWNPYDATLGRGGIGPGHLKITDAHWHKEKSFAPLLPVLRVLIAQPKVTIGEIDEKK